MTWGVGAFEIYPDAFSFLFVFNSRCTKTDERRIMPLGEGKRVVCLLTSFERKMLIGRHI